MRPPRPRSLRAVDPQLGVATRPVDAVEPVSDARSRDDGPDGESWSDEQLIGTWQHLRKALGAVEGRLACALATADAPGALVHEALAAIAASPTGMVPMSRLADVLGLSTGGCTKLVDRLVTAGFARRHHSSTDRRVIYAALTDEGAAHERRSTGEYAQQLRIELSVLGPARLAELRGIATVLRGWTTSSGSDTDPAETSAAPPGGVLLMGLPSRGRARRDDAGDAVSWLTS